MGKTTVKHTLLAAGSATGEWFTWPGGVGVFRANATWGGGTVKLQAKEVGAADGTAFDVGSDVTLTANGGGQFSLDACLIRAHVATATAVNATAGSLE